MTEWILRCHVDEKADHLIAVGRTAEPIIARLIGTLLSLFCSTKSPVDNHGLRETTTASDWAARCPYDRQFWLIYMESLSATLSSRCWSYRNPKRCYIAILVPPTSDQVPCYLTGSRTPSDRLRYLQCRDQILSGQSPCSGGVHGFGMPRGFVRRKDCVSEPFKSYGKC